MKCDIIIPVWNELEITKKCIDSIFKNTRFAYRLIIIDNASDTETCDYLNGLRSKFPDLLLIRNQQNLGYVKAINQGFKLSEAEFVCLLNNDTIVCSGWLEEMIEVMAANYKLGIVNPSSNTLAQYVPKGQSVESYARSLEIFKGQWGELGQCFGFCMLIRRKLIEEIGIFDEAYEAGYFEETDFCRRAQKAGFIFARAKAAYVSHLERGTFSKRDDKEELFEKNREIFESRWGRSLRIACIISKPPKDKIDKDETEDILLTSARDNHKVYVYIRKGLISKFNIAEHSNILIFRSNNIFFGFIYFFKILAKKSAKRFDLILTDGIASFYFLKIFTFIHTAKLMFNPHLERAIAESKKASLSK